MGFDALYWWIDRWRKSAAYMDMTLEEQAAYRNLLDEATLRGGVLPNDERVLAKACGDAMRWKAVRAAVLAKFVAVDGGWRNATLDEVLAETQRRADKQKRWRSKRGNGSGNDDGNAGGNGDGNAGRNVPRNNVGNKRGSPDQDLDLDRESKERSLDPRARAFIGQRLRVTENQLAVVLAELGTDAELLDWPVRFGEWDRQLVESGEPFDTLVFVKARAREEIAAVHRATPSPRGGGETDWSAECQALHNGGCGGQMKHHTRMLMDAERAKAVTA